MKGDFSRLTFDPKKHYCNVLDQQGRVRVEADWNEQQAIQQYRVETEARDVIGLCGAPKNNPGFEIIPGTDANDFTIGIGRYYVDGILCENDEPVSYKNQPDLPEPLDLSALKPGQVGLVYLDVWQRHITALDDPHIREVALGGPDTATRVKTVWQVKVEVVAGESSSEKCCSEFDAWKRLTQPSSGTLKAHTHRPKDEDNPCVTPATAGYQRLENQLYRVEIHKPGAAGEATFKWSRDNGTVVTAIEKISGAEIMVSDTGRDAELGFARGQWVEILDDATELNGVPGELRLISHDVQHATRVITLDKQPSRVLNRTRHPKLRRWDQSGATATSEGITTKGDLELEGGIHVEFSPGKSYKTGDYWTIPARTAGDIEWPTLKGTANEQPPEGIIHHYCCLAVISRVAGGVAVTDCRSLFPPLTELTRSLAPVRDGGVHVTGLFHMDQFFRGTALHNDMNLPVNHFQNGLQIECDAEVDPTCITDKPVCFVMLEVPFFRGGGGLPRVMVGFQSVILDGSVRFGFEPVEGGMTLDRRKILWTPADEAFKWTQSLFSSDIERLLARLTLKGNFIWQNGKAEQYLDGEVFGIGRGTDTDVGLPSRGDGSRGGDLEMWFWITPDPPGVIFVTPTT